MFFVLKLQLKKNNNRIYSQVSRDVARFTVFTLGTVVENLLVCGVPALSHRSTLHTIDSFQSRDQLEDLEGKTSI